MIEEKYEYYYNTCKRNLKNKYGEDLKIIFKYDKEKDKVYLVYYCENIDFLNDNLLYDLYTQIDEVLIPNGLKNVSLFFDSEKEYVREEKIKRTTFKKSKNPIKDKLDKIDTYFDNLSNEEFEEMLVRNGINEIK